MSEYERKHLRMTILYIVIAYLISLIITYVLDTKISEPTDLQAFFLTLITPGCVSAAALISLWRYTTNKEQGGEK